MWKQVRTTVVAGILLSGADAVRAQAPQRIEVPRIVVRNVQQDSPEDQIFVKARRILEQVVNDPRFKAGILQGGFRGSKYRYQDGTVEDKSPQQVWNIIRCGIERPVRSGLTPDRQIDLEVLLVPKTRPTVGSTFLGQLPIRTGYWFVNAAIANDDGVSLARHMMHEWMHVAGFFHYPSNSARGDVPYRVGELVKEIAGMLRLEAAVSVQSQTMGLEADRWRAQVELMTENSLLGDLLEDAEDQLEVGGDERRGARIPISDGIPVDAPCRP
jgi:hypothetical protein